MTDLGDFMSSAESDAGKVAKGDIVWLDFTGYVQETNELFDTTDAQVAKDNGVFNEKVNYTAIPVLVGGGRIFQGLDESIEGAVMGEQTEVIIPPEKAAGQRDPKLIDMVPLREFLKQDIEPHLGMEVNIKNRTGIVTAVTAGRVRVDFNRRLAGKSLKYVFKVLRKAENTEEKVKAILDMDYGTSEGFVISSEENVYTITLPDVCKYDQKWLLAKYRVVADLREGLSAGTVRFIEEYVKREEEKTEPAPEEIAPEENPFRAINGMDRRSKPLSSI